MKKQTYEVTYSFTDIMPEKKTAFFSTKSTRKNKLGVLAFAAIVDNEADTGRTIDELNKVRVFSIKKSWKN